MGYNTLIYKKTVILLFFIFYLTSKGYAQTYFYVQQVGNYISESAVMPIFIVQDSDSNTVHKEETGVELSINSKCFDELDSLINICGEKLKFITDTVFSNNIFTCCDNTFPTGSYQILKYVNAVPISGKLIQGADNMKLFLCYLDNEIDVNNNCKGVVAHIRGDLELSLYRMIEYKK
ncbi:MAG: hypothetical protein M9897_05705 [Brumimicrobium sp.]|nr:hypothetical protein [Brumimicrobium sp.]